MPVEEFGPLPPGQRPRPKIKRHRFALDQRFEGSGFGIGLHRGLPQLHLSNTGGIEFNFGEDGRAGILARKLTKLPLPGEHPERVMHIAPQHPVELGFTGAGFEPVPGPEGFAGIVVYTSHVV